MGVERARRARGRRIGLEVIGFWIVAFEALGAEDDAEVVFHVGACVRTVGWWE